MEAPLRERVVEAARYMSALLVSELTLEEIFDSFCDLLAALVEASVIEVAVRDGENWIRLRYVDGHSTRRLDVTLPYNDPTVATVAFGRTLLETGPARFSMPLAIGDEIVGAVAIRSDAIQAYDDADATVVQSIAPYLAVAIRQRMLLHTVQRERFRAEHDPLTRLANRALFDERANMALAHSRRAKERVAIVYLDLDGFKSVNDVYGHSAGDKVLRAVARRLRRSVRRSDTIARMGGDEFAILLEDVRDRNAVEELAAKIVAVVERPIRWNDSRLQVGISSGAAIAPDDGIEAKELLRRADERMYAHKNSRKRAV